MEPTDQAERAARYAQRLIDNRYAQENLNDAVNSLRDAYQRASKRRVEPARDEKVRRQIREAALSLTEAAKALKSGRQKPKKPRGRRLLILLGLGAAGVIAALAASEELRNKVFGGSSVARRSGDGAPPSPSAERPVD